MIRIGTSGWTYPHWRGELYPRGLPQRLWLEHYASRFDTVELNASFYRIPKQATVRAWAERTPADFRFAVKVSRLITHVRRLRDCAELLQWFFGELEPLRDKLCACLFQLPPSFAPQPELLESFLSLLPQGLPYVFELRNPDSYAGAVPRMLEKHGIGFCIHDLPGRETPLLLTSPLAYVRFHGTAGRYSGAYSQAQLRRWAQRMRSWSDQGHEVLAYFNNDIGGHAVRDALSLRDCLQR